MTPRAAIRAAATATTLRRAALALLLAATLLAGGMLAGPAPPASATNLAVSAIAIQSSAGSDTQYHTGDDITIRVTFGSETITAHTGATITIDVGGENRTATAADVASGGANAYVDFTYTVTDADRDTDGITVAAGTLGGSYSHTDAHTGITFTQAVSASASHRVNVDVTNYDRDGDGLIEINTLAQLNAIRYDLDGNGQPAAASVSSYAAAFPARSESHGCPDTAADADTDPGPCLGYELTSDLDFDTNGDGAVNASDAYPNWTPIADTATAAYTANFNGNGHTIARLTINATSQFPAVTNYTGLFGHVSGNLVIENVGLTDVDITVNRTGSSVTLHYGGALIGFVRGKVRASYATGALAVTASGQTTSVVGGLIGRVGGTSAGVRGELDASWANVNITLTSTSSATFEEVGGLVGGLYGHTSSRGAMTASYARGAVTVSDPSRIAEGGLAGRVSNSSVTASYWDTVTSTLTSSAGGTGQTTTALQTPTGYTGIYENWNIDVDGDGNADDPWDFGTGSQYPVLKYASHDFAAQGRPFDYDADNDGLIDITTLAQLDAIRHDLNGDGNPAGAAGIAAFRKAFPHRVRSVAGRMGCQPTDHDSMPSTPDQATCTGYELLNDLDFDTNRDGSVGSGDEYSNWTPIGGLNAPYTGTLQGNGHIINNLRCIHYGGRYIGLFGALGTRGNNVPQKGRIDALGVTNANVLGWQGVGVLVGLNSGHIVGSYATGSVTGTSNFIGGLVGRTHHPNHRDYSRIIASYSTVTVTGPGQLGGLVGLHSNGPIIASYAAGPVSSTSQSGGLTGTSAGSAYWVGTYANSYWDKDVTNQSNSYTSSQAGVTTGNAGSNTASTTGATTTIAMQSSTGYGATTSDTFYGLNVDVDGDANTGDDQGRDDPWDFRLGHYPVLKYGGLDVDKQRPLQAEAGAAAQAYSGQTVTLDGSGSRWPSGATPTYLWAQIDDGDEGDPDVTLAGANTASPTFPAPTGLTSDRTLKFRLTVTAGGRSVYDEVVVTIIAVRPNQLLSLSLTDPEGDAVGLAPSFLSLRYDYRASVANQIASVTVTPRVLSGSTMTLNGQAVTSGAEVEVPLKYRGNEIVIIVTPPEPEPSETMDGETADGETTDETVEETPCSVENNGVKPCTYTITVRRAVPPRLAFIPRSLTIDEGGTGTYTVELDTRILTGAVTIAIASDHPAVTVSPTEVTLKPLDMAPRTITVTAAADDDRDDENVVITHTANGAHYYDVIATVGVTVNDTTAPPPAPAPALSVSATALRLAEGGSGAYTVALATRPDDNVTVTIGSDNADVTTRPAVLTFTTANWPTAQRVTVSAASDGDTANDTATLTHTASGGGYADAPAVQVAVSVTDDDTAGLSITPTVLNLIENGISAYIVSLTAQPSANVTVSIASDNPDVTVRPTALTFTPTNWATPQAVLVITRADAGGGDELATLRMTAQGGGYGGQTGQVLASVDDTLAPLAVNADAPAGVSVYGPPGGAATATVSAPADDTPTTATGAGFGIGPAVAVSVSDAPADGLEICLPVSSELRAEAGSALVLTLLRYAAGAWTELSGARDLGDRVCAAGVAGQAAYAAGYALRPGTVLDLAASVGADPGTIALSWTPPAAGTAQVAVVVNVADDTDYCLDTLPGLDASSYTCAGRRAGATYVALLIVLLPDGGYTLANIVRLELPAAGGR